MTRLRVGRATPDQVQVERRGRPRRSRTPHAADGLSTSTDRRDGYSRRMRARCLRSLHRYRGRIDHPRLPDARSADRRKRCPHCGGSRARSRSTWHPAGRFQAPSRAAMRLLHSRDPDVADHYLRERPSPTEDELRDLLSGHLCRCTGYTPIIRAALDAANLFAKHHSAEKTDV